MEFKDAWAIVQPWEGGYVNDPSDPGGETNYGISKRAFPNEDIKNMTPDRAGILMYDNYWQPESCGNAFMPDGINLYVFDMAVNMGIDKAGRVLQAAINQVWVNNKQAGLVAIDGKIGPATLSALMKLHPVHVLIELDGLRAYTYGTYPGFNKYGYGWERRAAYMLAHGVLATVQPPATPVVVDRTGDLKHAITQFVDAWQ